MKLTVLDDAQQVALAAAESVRAAVEDEPDLVLGLPTGKTAIPFYGCLRQLYGAGRLDLSRARAFNIDELMLPADHPASFHAFMLKHAGERIGLRAEHWDIPDGTADPVTECDRYERALAQAGGMDLAVLGIGADGHVAYNLPGLAAARTHVVDLPDELAERLDVEPRWRPLRALTMGMETIRGARRLLLMATGARKARAVETLAGGSISDQWPCTLLRDHPAFEVWLDADAASRLSEEMKR